MSVKEEIILPYLRFLTKALLLLLWVNLGFQKSEWNLVFRPVRWPERATSGCYSAWETGDPG